MQKRKILTIILSAIILSTALFQVIVNAIPETKVFKIVRYKSDIDPVAYRINTGTQTKKILNILEVENGNAIKRSAVYCLMAGVGFEEDEATETYDLNYNMIEERDKIQELAKENTKINNLVNGKKYNKILALIDIMYIPGESSKEYKSQLMERVKDEYLSEYTDIKEELSDNDIDAVNQAVIWTLTNNEQDRFKNYYRKDWLQIAHQNNNDGRTFSNLSFDKARQVEALYKYLIDKVEALTPCGEIVEEPCEIGIEAGTVVSIREMPGINSKVLKELEEIPENITVTRIRKDVSYINGYIWDKVKIEINNSALEATVPEETPSEVVEPEVIEGYIQRDNLFIKYSEAEETFEVSTEDGLRVRSLPSTTGDAIASIMNGDTVIRLDRAVDKNGKWDLVKVYDEEEETYKIGFVNNKYLPAPSKTTYYYLEQGKITASSLNIRSKPSSSGKSVGGASKNEIVTVLATKVNGTNWHLIETSNGTIGYSSSSYIELTGEKVVNTTNVVNEIEEIAPFEGFGEPATISRSELKYEVSGSNYIVGPIKVIRNNNEMLYGVDVNVKIANTKVEEFKVLDNNKKELPKIEVENIDGIKEQKYDLYDYEGDFYISTPITNINTINVEAYVTYDKTIKMLWTSTEDSNDPNEKQVQALTVIDKERQTTETVTLEVEPEIEPEAKDTLTKTTTKDKITSSKDSITYNVEYNAEISSYIGNAEVTLIDTLPEGTEIDIEKSNLGEGAIYDEKTNTITWKQTIENINTFKEESGKISIPIRKEFTVVFKKIDLTKEKIINKVNSKLVLDKKELENESEVETPIVRAGVCHVLSKTAEPSIITSLGDPITYTVRYTGLISQYIGEAKIKLIDVLPEELDVDVEKLTVELEKTLLDKEKETVSYNAETKTITWEINLGRVNTYEEAGGQIPFEIEKKFNVVYTNIKVSGDKEKDKVINKLDSELYLSAQDENNPVDKRHTEVETPIKIDPVVKDTLQKESITKEINRSDSEVTYKVTYDADISSYIGNAELYLEDTLPGDIDEEKSNLGEGATYNKEKNTIIWKVDLGYIDTYKETAGIKKVHTEKTFTVSYKNLDMTQDKIINKINSRLILVSEYNKTIEKTSEAETPINRMPEATSELNKISVTEKIASASDAVTYKVRYNAEIKSYIGNSEVTLTDTLPGEIDIEKSNLGKDAVYDENTHTIIWKVDLGYTNTYKETNNTRKISVEKEFSVVYKNLDMAQNSIKNKVDSKLILTDYDKERPIDEKHAEVDTPIVRESKVEDKLQKESITKRIESTSEPVKYKVTYNGDISAYIGKAELYLEDTLLGDIDEEKSNLGEGATYNKETKTITWKIDLGDINTYKQENGKVSVNVEKEFEVVYTNISQSQDKINNKVKSRLVLVSESNKTIEKTAEVETPIIKTPEAKGELKKESVTEKIVSSDSAVTYKVKYNADIKYYTGKVEATLVDTLPDEIDIEKSNLGEGAIYDKEAKTITWKVDLGYIDTSKEVNNVRKVSLEKEFTVVYKNLDMTKSSINNKVDSKLILTDYDKEKPIDEKHAEVDTPISKDVKVEDKVQKQSVTEEIKTSNQPVKYKVTYTGEITSYNGKAEVTLVDTLPYDIDLDKSELGEGASYNKDRKTIIWKAYLGNINTNGDNKKEISVEKEFTVVYKNLDMSQNTITNIVNSKLVLENQEKTNEAEAKTPIVRDAKVTDKLQKESVTKEMKSLDDKITYTVKYDVDISSYTGKAELYLEDILPFDIDLNESELNLNEGDSYNAKTRTIRWKINLGHINSYKEDSEIKKISVEKVFTVLYRNINMPQESIKNIVNSRLVLIDQDNKEITNKSEVETSIKIEPKVEDKLSKEGITKEIRKADDNVSYKVSYEANISSYAGKAELYLEDILPYEIDEEKSALGEGASYNKETKTITWKIDLENINTYEEENKTKKIIIEKEFTVVYKDMDMTQSIVNNKVNSRLVLNNKEKTNEAKAEIPVIGKVIVRHIDRETEEILEEIEEDKKVGEVYKSSEKDFKGYILDEKPEQETITIKEGVTILEYYYVKPKTGVIEKHINIKTNELLEKETYYEGHKGDEYTTKEKEFEGYDLVKEKYPENAKGQMTDEVIEVRYYYVKKASVLVEHINKLTGEKLTEDEIIEGHEDDEYTTKEKEFEGYDLVKEEYPENAKGQMKITKNEDGTENTQIVVKYYYVPKAKVIEKHIDIKTDKLIEEETTYDGHVGDEYKTEEKKFEGYDYVKEEEPENKEGKMTEEPIEVKYYYIRKAKVVVEYIDDKTGEKINELINDEKVDSTEYIEGHEGDKYKTKEKEFENYKLVRKTDNTEGEMKIVEKPDGTVESTIYVKYYYVKKSAGVKERHIDIDTGKYLEKETEYSGYVGDKYATKEKEFEGYELVKEVYPENASGEMKEEEIIVKYYYKQKKKETKPQETPAQPQQQPVIYNIINNNNNPGTTVISDSNPTVAKKDTSSQVTVSKVPATGDILPILTGAVIALVIVSNIVVSIVRKRKSKKETM